MARLLVTTIPLAGHVQPLVPIVRELVLRGHDVVWTTAARYERDVTATGARFVAASREATLGAEDLAARLGKRRGLSRVKAQLDELFLSPLPAQLADLERLADAEHPAAIIADSAHLGAALLAEKRDLPWIQVGISALMVSSVDTAPFGSAIAPERIPSPRIRRFLNWLIFCVVFASTNRRWRHARVAAGLPAGSGTYFDVMSPELFLQPTVRAFEYPRSDLPPQVRFIGPLVPAASRERPAWWRDVEEARAAGRPIVLVSQGTLATDPRELIAPAVTGLADEPALVLLATDAAIEIPAHMRGAPFIPYAAALEVASVFVTNGGYGGVQMALAAGVPMVVAGGSEEKPEIAARVAWSGTGIDLRTGRPKPRAVRDAVRRVLADPTYREKARTFANAMARHDAVRSACDAIELRVGRREAA